MRQHILEIRNDDVLQTMKTTTAHQRADLRHRSLMETFIEADRPFATYNYPCTLAVLAEGLISEGEWVYFIKKNIDRYKIELHGFEHKNYSSMSEGLLWKELSVAKARIEDVFNVRITTWYPPFGRKGENPHGPAVCERLGMEQYKQVGKVDAKLWLKNPDKYPHVNFHYWNDAQVKTVSQIIKGIYESY